MWLSSCLSPWALAALPSWQPTQDHMLSENTRQTLAVVTQTCRPTQLDFQKMLE
jgi:hypothetical protein